MATITDPNNTLTSIIGATVFPTAPQIDANGVPITTTSTNVPQTPSPTTPQELDGELSEYQRLQLLASTDFDTYFESEEGKTAAQNLRTELLPGGEEAPKPPSLVEQFEAKRNEYGLDTLEAELNDLRREEREQQAIRRERIGSTYEQRSRMSAIQGQVTEIERQEMERLDFIGREIQYRTDLINSAYNVINLYTQLTQQDWQNSKEWWTTQFNANMAMHQQLQSEYEFEKTFAQQQLEWQQSVATANLQIYIDMISNGQLFYDNMDAATKADITKLEIQSGLGIGFISKIQIDPDKQIKSITTRIDGTTKYADIIKVDPRTGKVTVESVRLGREYTYTGGGGSGSSATTNTAIENMKQDKLAIQTQFEKVNGADGFVSPVAWNTAYKKWVALGYPAEDFYKTFSGYVNHSHYKDYLGAKLQATQGTSMNTQTGGYPQVGSDTYRMA